MDELTEFRRRKDAFFAESEDSPLSDDQRAHFAGLRYYPANEDLVVTAPLEPSEDPEPFTIPTSDGSTRTYWRAGTIRFSVEGREVALSLLASEHSHDLFLPFRDATSGKETYGAGRYVDVGGHGHLGEDVTVDFNLAYNPYCAYNEAYSCPLPPPENWLDVPIRAGELRFDAGH